MVSTNTPADTTMSSAPADGALRSNALGTGGIVFLVISAAAPLTVIAGSVPLAILIAGPVAPTAYLLIGVVLAIFSFAFLGMVRHLTKPGGFYSTITEALGKRVGLAAGVLAVVSYNVMQIGIYGLFAVAAGELLRATLGIELHWSVLAFVAIAAVWALGFTGIQIGARVLGVLLVAEVVMLVALGIAIIATGGGADGFTMRMLDPELLFTPGFAAVIALAFAAFIGFEATVLFRAEARDPQRTVPRATYLAVGLTTVFYVAITWVLIQAYGDDLVQAFIGETGPSLFFFAAADDALGAWGLGVFNVLVVTSGFAALLAFHNSINRYFFVLGRDRVLPAALARTRVRNGSPWVAGLVQTGLAAVLVAAFAIGGGDPYLHLLIWLNTPGVLGVLVLQVLASIAVVVHFRRHPDRQRHALVVPAAVAAAVLLLGFVVLVTLNIDALTGADGLTNAAIVAVTPVSLVAGLVLAAWLRRRRPDAYAQIGDEA